MDQDDNIFELELTNNNLKHINLCSTKTASLTKLNISHNLFCELPNNIDILCNLQTLNISRNNITHFPETMSNLKNLKSIIANNNKITHISKNILEMYWLEYFDISANPTLTIFPKFAFNIDLKIDNHPKLIEEFNNINVNFVPNWNNVYPDQILPNLFLGSAKSVSENYVYEYYDIKNIITLAGETRPKINSDTYHKIFVVSDLTGNGFDKCIDYIDEFHNLLEKNTLVHCQFGISRSASFILAYLMKYCNMRLDDAYFYVKDRRDCICPSDKLWKKLIDFDSVLHKDKEKRNFDNIRE
jgi:hypothetical protein